jgi:hypothetical protein
MNRLTKVLLFSTLSWLLSPSVQAQKSIASSVRQITTDTVGHKWLLGFNYQTAVWTTTKGWYLHPTGFRARFITASPQGVLYTVGYDDQIYRDVGRQFMLVDSNYRARRVAIDRQGTLWIIGLSDEIFSRRDGRWAEHPGDFRARELVLDRSGKPYIIGTDQRIFASTGTGWQLVKNAPKALKMAFDNKNRLWLIDTANELHGEIKAGQWNRYPGRRSREIAFGPGQVMYFVGYWNNRLYREILTF